MTDRTGQSAVQAVSVTGNRQTSPIVLADPAVKYNPGWGLSDQGAYTASDVGIRAAQQNRIIEVGAMSNVKHFMAWFTWGSLQSGPTTYTFDIVDAVLALCQQQGKRLSIVVQWSAQTASTALTTGTFLPAYLSTSLGLIFQSNPARRMTVAMFQATAMTEYIKLLQAISDRYNNHPWFEGVHTYDSAQQMSNIPGYTVGQYRDQLIRLCEAAPGIFPNTNFFISLDSGLSGASNMQQVVQAAADNRCIMTCIDLMLIDFTQFTHQTLQGGELAQRVYQGVEGTKNFKSTLAYAPRAAQGNFGDAGLPSNAQYPANDILDVLLLQVLRTNLDARYMFVPYKTSGFGTSAVALANNQWWNTAVAGYSTPHPTFKEFLNLSAGAIALNTAIPPNYTNVITGGT